MVESACGTPSEDQLLEHFTAECRQRYSESIEGIINLGLCLIEAKSELSGASWKQLCQERDRCPVSETVATRFMKIAQNRNILKREIWLFLPLGWNVLYEISLLTDEQFDNGIRQNKITPEATMDDIRLLRNKEPHSAARRAEKERSQVEAPAVTDPEEVAELAALLTHTEPAVATDEEQGRTAAESQQTTSANATRSPAGRKYRLVVMFRADSAEQVETLKHEIERELERFSFAEVDVYEAD